MNTENLPPTMTSTGLPELQGMNPRELFLGGLKSGPGPLLNWEPPTTAHLAELLPQYSIEGLVGFGGMGAVYKGCQAVLNRPVAIKLLPAEMAADAGFVARFQREARTLAGLQHPGIVAVYDFGQTREGHLYFVMEFVDGTDLYRVIHGPGLDPSQALEVTSQICDALHYAHRQGVIHRDIKPANVLITKDGRAKLADFGLARPVTEASGTLTGSNIVMGTPDYMAPEQREGMGDHRADIYALGVMLYEMLTGRRPYGVFDPPSARVPVDARLDQVVLKAMQQEPDRRYQQASEMQLDMQRIRTSPLELPGAEPEAAREERRRKPAGKKSLLPILSGVGALAAMVVGGLWLAFHRPDKAPSHSTEAVVPESAVTVEIAKAPASPKQSETPVITPVPPALPAPAPVIAKMDPVPAPSLPRWTALEQAVKSGGWLWADALYPNTTVLFQEDGTVSGRWAWKTMGPRTVHVQFTPQSGADLVFDESLVCFDGRFVDDNRRSHAIRGALASSASAKAIIASQQTVASPPAATAAPSALPAAPATGQIQAFAEQGPNIAAWITSPLTVTVPDAIWENLNFLKEALKDEAAQKPAATPAAYQLGVRYCTTLLGYLEERDQSSARAGGNAVLHQKSNLTQQNRDHLTWPQYALERDERAERHENARNADTFQNGHRDVNWNTRTTTMRRDMQALYSQLREALRQPMSK